MEPQKPILIVEDEKSLMEAVRIKLTHDGFSTACAGSAEEAEEIIPPTTFSKELELSRMASVRAPDFQTWKARSPVPCP